MFKYGGGGGEGEGEHSGVYERANHPYTIYTLTDGPRGGGGWSRLLIRMKTVKKSKKLLTLGWSKNDVLFTIPRLGILLLV